MNISPLPAMCALAFCVAGASAGPLAPPSGPVVSTGPAVVNALPGDAASNFVISAPGHYVLTGDLAPSFPLAEVLRIDAPDVTVDLNGFSIVAPGFSDGVEINASRVTLRNGSITSLNRTGIFIVDGTHAVFEDLRVHDCGSGGILNNGSDPDGHAARRCTFTNLAGPGIRLSGASTIEDCVLDGAGSIGIQVGPASVVRNCIVTNTMAAAVDVASYGQISNVTVRTCTVGVVLDSFSIATGLNVSNITGGTGIQGGGSCALSRAVVQGISAGDGLNFGELASLTDVTVRTASARGIVASTDSRLVLCTSAFTGSHGIEIASGALLDRCFARDASGDGFRLRGNTIVTDSRATTNAGAGFSFQSGSRITGCLAASNSVGYTTIGSTVFDSNTARTNATTQFFLGGSMNVVTRNIAIGVLQYEETAFDQVAEIIAGSGTHTAAQSALANFAF